MQTLGNKVRNTKDIRCVMKKKIIIKLSNGSNSSNIPKSTYSDNASTEHEYMQRLSDINMIAESPHEATYLPKCTIPNTLPINFKDPKSHKSFYEMEMKYFGKIIKCIRNYTIFLNHCRDLAAMGVRIDGRRNLANKHIAQYMMIHNQDIRKYNMLLQSIKSPCSVEVNEFTLYCDETLPK